MKPCCHLVCAQPQDQRNLTPLSSSSSTVSRPLPLFAPRPMVSSCQKSTRSQDMGLLCRPSSRRRLILCMAAIPALYLLYLTLSCDDKSKLLMVPNNKNRVLYDNDHRAIPYGEDMEIIFIGGVPRSGTTLMRVMLDAHPEVRCGEETRVIPRMLGMRSQWEKSSTEKRRLEAAGVTSDVLDSAVRSFILEVVARHGEAAPRLCNKDPFTHKFAVYLSKQFSQSKFLLMIRDGRAVVHSIITRKVTITGFDLSNFRSCMKNWNRVIETMYSQCLKVGAGRCMPVYYEQLALHPREWMEKITQFLGLSWNETVLHHEDFIGEEISLSRTEKSTDQVIKPVNIEALSKWVGNIPQDVVTDMPKIAPMLSTLGYDPLANPPDYGKPDPQVADNTLHIRTNADVWKKKEEKVFKQLGGRPEDMGGAAETQSQRHGKKVQDEMVDILKQLERQSVRDEKR